MADLSTVSAILSSVKTATEIASLLKSTDLSFEKAEKKLKLAELIGALADAKMEISEIQEIILQKDRKIRELQEALEIEESLKFEQPYYWRVTDSQKEGPFCQHCYDKDRKLVRLLSEETGCWNCRICKNIYLDSSYQEPDMSHLNGEW